MQQRRLRQRILRWVSLLAPSSQPPSVEGHGILHGGQRMLQRLVQGRAAQVDPMKPMLKAPGTKRLKL